MSAPPRVVRRRVKAPEADAPTPVESPPAPAAAPAPTPSFPAPAPAPASKPRKQGGPAFKGSTRSTPAEHLDVEGAWALADLASACTVPGLDAANRLDPYWHGLWTGSAPHWLNPTLVERQASVGLSRVPKVLSKPRREAIDYFLSPNGIHARLNVLGVLHSWRTCSAEQVAVLTGKAEHGAPLGKVLSNAFAARLVEFGYPMLSSLQKDQYSRATLLRPSDPEGFNRQVVDRLTWAEWLSVTGGQPWSTGSRYDRHNVLATEVGIRAAEYTDAATVLGERFSTVDLLAGSGVGLPPRPATDRRAADVTVVRRDGVRVAIEVTATISPYFDKKVAKWAKLLAESSWEDTGLAVIFLVAASPGSEWNAESVRVATYQAVARAVREFPGVSVDRTAERIGVATWAEWFPGPHLTTDRFLGLRADRPTGSGAGLWVECDFLDTSALPFTARDSETILAVVENARTLAQTPPWMREAAFPLPMSELLLDSAGITSVPHPTPTRPARTKNPGPLQHRGVAAPPTLPYRLRGTLR